MVPRFYFQEGFQEKCHADSSQTPHIICRYAKISARAQMGGGGYGAAAPHYIYI